MSEQTDVISQYSMNSVFPKLFCSRTVLGLTNNHAYIPADVNIVCPDDRYPKLGIYISELILDSYEYIPVAHVKMHCMIWP
jgi:hypothetical protein